MFSLITDKRLDEVREYPISNTKNKGIPRGPICANCFSAIIGKKPVKDPNNKNLYCSDFCKDAWWESAGN